MTDLRELAEEIAREFAFGDDACELKAKIIAFGERVQMESLSARLELYEDSFYKWAEEVSCPNSTDCWNYFCDNIRLAPMEQE